MPRTNEVIHRALRQVANLGEVEAQLRDAPDQLLQGMTRTRPPQVPGLIRSELAGPGLGDTEILVSEGSANTSDDAEGLDSALDAHRRHVLRTGAEALRKIRSHGANAALTTAERTATEAIILLVGRPAILIQDGRFFPPPEQWKQLNVPATRAAIESVCRSVGRVEVTGHPSLDWIGTAFLVAPNVIMTNRHVAQEFCRRGRDGAWNFEAQMHVSIDYVEELGATTSLDFTLERILGVHEDFDLSLFEVSVKSKNGDAPPTPLRLASDAADAAAERKVYVVGYPAWDGRRNDPESMRQIFADVYNVKRLQPGELTAVFEQESLLNHDCSTLGGNSGSCVVDLERHEVIGLHFGGKYLGTNDAVALWRLTKDPLLKKVGVNFV